MHIFFLLPARPHFREQEGRNFCTIKPCLYVSVFLYFYHSLHCLVCNTHSLVLRCLSSLFGNKNKNGGSLGSLGGDWIVLFGYVRGFKSMLPLSGKDMFSCVYSVPLALLPPRFYWSHVVWKFFN